MRPAEKLEYIYTYYKWPILLGVLVLLTAASIVQRQLTRKEPVIYLGFANVAVGEDLEEVLTVNFLRLEGNNAKRQEVYLYRDLYLSDDADVIVLKSAADYEQASAGAEPVQMLGHSMQAVRLPKGGLLTYRFFVEREGDYSLTTALIPKSIPASAATAVIAMTAFLKEGDIFFFT